MLWVWLSMPAVKSVCLWHSAQPSLEREGWRKTGGGSVTRAPSRVMTTVEVIVVFSMRSSIAPLSQTRVMSALSLSVAARSLGLASPRWQSMQRIVPPVPRIC